MKEKEVLSPRCPIRTTLDMLGGKWRLLILNTLKTSGSLRYRDISRNIPQISDKVLSKELRFLEENHLIKRLVKSDKIIQYQISEIGLKAADLTQPIGEFGRNYHSFLNELHN